MNLLSTFSGAVLKPAMQRLDRGRLPQQDGRIYLPGLLAPVTVSRDRWGIPTLLASSRQDLFLAQGFVHAQDRLWQMEIHRRAASGTLAAVVGEMGLETDRLSRTLGFLRHAQATWQLTGNSVQAEVQAYVSGVNAYLESGQPLPLEFSLLRHHPEPWTTLDTVAFGRMMAWILSHGFAHKLTRARIIDKIGPAAAAELELSYPADNPLTLPKGIEFNLLEPDGMLRAAEGPFIRRNMEGVGRGSNAWVISGRRSTTGHPILCNDMHLPVTTPSIWYALHLNCQAPEGQAALNVTGVSLPGVPYVLVGHNEHIAWGATVSFVDNEDLFVERFAPDMPGLYEFAGQWRQAEMIDERIDVRNGPAHHEKVILTHHGPLISRALNSSGQVLALASRSLKPNRSFDGFALLNEAQDWDDFVSAVHRIESPSLNLVYADSAGNIGHYVTGRAPIRRSGMGQVPVPGWTGDHEWMGDVPVSEMPHAFNPSAGFLVTANNKIVGDDFPYYLGDAWRNGYRARRIRDFIQANETLSLEDNGRLQSDLLLVPALEMLDLLDTCFGDAGCDDIDAQHCLEILRDWNGEMQSESKGALVYTAFLAELSLAVLVPALGQSLTEDYLGAGPHPTLYPFGETHSQWIVALLRMLRAEDSNWLSPSIKKKNLLQQCLAGTLSKLRASLGQDPQAWTLGSNHQIVFGHVLSTQRPLNAVFNVGPFAVGGDADTVCQMSVNSQDGSNNIAPSYRQLIDTHDWDASLGMHAPGQSGHLASPHYADLSQSWLKGDYYRLSWKQSVIDAMTVSHLHLLPPMSGAPESPNLDNSP